MSQGSWFFAVFLTAEKLWYGRALAKTRVFKHIYVLLLVVVSFVLFDANSVGEAAAASPATGSARRA